MKKSPWQRPEVGRIPKGEQKKKKSYQSKSPKQPTRGKVVDKEKDPYPRQCIPFKNTTKSVPKAQREIPDGTSPEWGNKTSPRPNELNGKAGAREYEEKKKRSDTFQRKKLLHKKHHSGGKFQKKPQWEARKRIFWGEGGGVRESHSYLRHERGQVGIESPRKRGKA